MCSSRLFCCLGGARLFPKLMLDGPATGDGGGTLGTPPLLVPVAVADEPAAKGGGLEFAPLFAVEAGIG